MLLSKDILCVLAAKPELIDTFVALHNKCESVANDFFEFYKDYFDTYVRTCRGYNEEDFEQLIDETEKNEERYFAFIEKVLKDNQKQLS